MELEFHQLEHRYEALRLRSRERERRLMVSLAEHGQQTPVVVVRAEQLGHYVLIDGHKRVRALKRLGKDTVSSTIWEMGEGEALVLERQLRRAERESVLEQGWLLRELHQRFTWSYSELARRFDRSVSWVSRRVSLVKELPEEIQQRVQRGELVAHAAMKYLVPLARANRADCMRLVDVVAARRLSSREFGKLYSAYVSGDEPVRELVLTRPELFLELEREGHRSAPAVEARAVEGLLSDLSVLGAVCRRAMRRWETGLGQNLVPPERERAERLLRQVAIAFDELVNRCDKELRDVGSEPTDGDSRTFPQGVEQSEDCPRAQSLPIDGTQSAPKWQPRSASHPTCPEGRTLSGRDSATLRTL